MDKIICKTTRQHYEKYKELAQKAGVSLKDCKSFGGKKKLTRLFLEDENLNQFPLQKFDVYFSFHLRTLKRFSLAENTCMYKHLLIYEVIGAIPEFYKTWRKTELEENQDYERI